MHRMPLLAVLGLVAAAHAHAGHSGLVAWESNPAAGLARAKTENKAAILYFSATW